MYFLTPHNFTSKSCLNMVWSLLVNWTSILEQGTQFIFLEKTKTQVTGLGNRGSLKVLNDTKLILDDYGKSVTGQELFFVVSYSKPALKLALITFLVSGFFFWALSCHCLLWCYWHVHLWACVLFWHVLILACAHFGMCSFWHVLFSAFAGIGKCTFCHLLFSVCVLFGMCLFWHVLFLVCALFGMCPYWHELFFGMCPYWHVLFLACSLFSMWCYWHLHFWACALFVCALIAMCSLFGMYSYWYVLFLAHAHFGMCSLWCVLFFFKCSFWHWLLSCQLACVPADKLTSVYLPLLYLNGAYRSQK